MNCSFEIWQIWQWLAGWFFLSSNVTWFIAYICASTSLAWWQCWYSTRHQSDPLALYLTKAWISSRNVSFSLFHFNDNWPGMGLYNMSRDGSTCHLFMSDSHVIHILQIWIYRVSLEYKCWCKKCIDSISPCGGAWHSTYPWRLFHSEITLWWSVN